MGENPRFWTAFSILLLAFALFTIMSVWMTVQAHAAPAHTQKVEDIQNDWGGDVQAYFDKYKKLSDRGATVRVHGLCASACTMALMSSYFPSLHLCAADPMAVFAFHKPFALGEHGEPVVGGIGMVLTQVIWDDWINHYPPKVAKFLNEVPHVPSAAEGDPKFLALLLPAKLLIPAC